MSTTQAPAGNRGLWPVQCHDREHEPCRHEVLDHRLGDVYSTCANCGAKVVDK